MAKLLIIGKSGQLAQSFAELSDTVLAGRNELDLTDSEAIKALISKHDPVAVVNTAAYTAVDLAEMEKEAAYLVNELGARNVATCCAELGVKLVHISTDYVFDGEGMEGDETKLEAYKESDVVNPLGVYGKSKLAGESAVLEVLESAIIVRTSWLYGGEDSNFVATMLRLGSDREEMAVVSDQFGRPTFVNDLRDAVVTMILGNATGLYHFSNSGMVVSWYDFALEIFRQAQIYGLKTPDKVRQITSAEYPTAASRPAWSVLDISKYESEFGKIAEWKTSLEFYFSNRYK